jgi:hypothetical protein
MRYSFSIVCGFEEFLTYLDWSSNARILEEEEDDIVLPGISRLFCTRDGYAALVQRSVCSHVGRDALMVKEGLNNAQRQERECE